MEQMNKTKLKRTREFGDLITDTFGYVREHYKTLGKSILYFVIPFIAIASIFMGSYFQQSMAISNNPETLAGLGNMVTLLGTVSGMGIFGMLASAAMSAVVYNHMALLSDSAGAAVTVNQIWDRFKKDIWAILGITILTGLLVGLGFLFFVIPGIILYTKFALIPAAYIKERTSISDAFSRSWNLTTNFWWFTFGLIIVMGILVSFMSYFLTVPIMIVSMFTGIAGGDVESVSSIFTLVYSIAGILSYIFYSLVFISLGLHYFNLVERKEGTSMKERIDQINPGTSGIEA